MAKESKARPPKDWNAYQCVLLYYEYVESGTPDNLRRAIECSERATAADRVSIVPDPLDRALAAALKGVQADPMSQQAHWGLAQTYFHRGERQLFKEEAKVALELNPNRAYIVGNLGWALAHAGEWDQGIALIEKAYELIPAVRHFGCFRSRGTTTGSVITSRRFW